MDDDMRKEVLGEVLMDELRTIREYVEVIPAMSKKLDTVADDVEALKIDMKAVKAVMHEHDSEIKQLKEKVA